MSDHKLNATLKAGAAYDAPWLTIGSDDPGELHSLLTRFAGVDASVDTAAAVVAAATKLQNFWTAKDTLGGQVVTPQPQQPAPQGPATNFISGNVLSGQQAAPQQPVQQQQTAPAPSCIHGPMTRRTSKPGADKAWAGYFCPQPKGAPDQCKPIWDSKN